MPGPGTVDPQALRLLALAVALVGTAAAHAADDEPAPIPTEVRSAQVIDDAQKKQIAAFVDGWFVKLNKGNRGEVALAQEGLIRPVEGIPGPTPAFREAYAAALAQTLPKLTKHEDPQVRMAVMIVASSVGGPAVTDLLATGMADAHLGVRYFAARAVADMFAKQRDPTGPPPLPDAQQQVLLTALKAGTAKETSPVVMEQMGRAVSGLTIAASFDETVAILRDRLEFHRLNPEASPRAAGAMMEKLLTRINIMEGSGKPVDQPLQSLTAAAGLYMAALAELIQSERAPKTAEGQAAWAELTDIIENKVFDDAVKKFAPTANRPPLTSHIRKEPWDEAFAADILLWVGKPNEPGILTTDLRIPLVQLQLPTLPQPPAPPATPPAAEPADNAGM